ncbi:MAG: pseudouridine-5'-phosphate glycosidase [Deltaproteobacteria bacterium]|nr:pseudouridine-5'-phosphate glycosidase [Deltaproteobacteria bacterium]
MLRPSAEVAAALALQAPIVALESTLLAHGLPKEESLEAAHAIEAAVREEGAVPATIAIIDGAARIGLDDQDLETIVWGPTKKASLRDLAPALALGGVHATTVAATMAIARRAGVRFFATGGIGGVHRGADQTFDESADLMALATEPVLVVSAGAKSVLDLARTLERLESLGVPVIGCNTNKFPAFYHRGSELDVPYRVDEPSEIARVFAIRLELQQGGMLVVQPPPTEPDISEAELASWIDEALADPATPRGPALTPFLLARLADRSRGQLVDVNVELVVANARLAARIAVASSHI